MADTTTTAAEDDKAATKTVNLAVAWPVTSHTHGDIEITQEGTEVPASKAKTIIADAATAGVTIREVN